MTRILVCGGRDFSHVVRTKPTIAEELPEIQQKIEEYQFIQEALNQIVNQESANCDINDNWLPTDITIISGGAKGVDRAAEDFANVQFCALQIFEADWKTHGKRAGYLRNVQMLKEGKPDLVVAFPGGKGTAMMIDLAIKAKVKVIQITGEQGNVHMDILGTSKKPLQLQTEKYRKEYIDRVQQSQATHPAFKHRIYIDCLNEELKYMEYLNSMDAEYNEIIQGEDLVNDLQKGGLG
jgi:hypothetical protein